MITPSIDRENQQNLPNYAGLYQLGNRTQGATVQSPILDEGMLYQNALFNHESVKIRRESNKIVSEGIRLLKSEYNGNFQDMHEQELAKMAEGDNSSWIARVYNLHAEQQRVQSNKGIIKNNEERFNEAITDNKDRLGQVYLDPVTRQPELYQGRFLTVGEYLETQNRGLGYRDGYAELFTPPQTVDPDAFDSAVTSIFAQIGKSDEKFMNNESMKLFGQMQIIADPMGEGEDVNALFKITQTNTDNLEQIKSAQDNFWTAINENARDAVREEFYRQRNLGTILMVGDKVIGSPEEYAFYKVKARTDNQTEIKRYTEHSMPYTARRTKENDAKSFYGNLSMWLGMGEGNIFAGKAWDLKYENGKPVIDTDSPPDNILHRWGTPSMGTQNAILKNQLNREDPGDLTENPVTLGDYGVDQVYHPDWGWFDILDKDIKIVGFANSVLLGPKYIQDAHKNKLQIAWELDASGSPVSIDENGDIIDNTDKEQQGQRYRKAVDQLYIEVEIQRDGALGKKLKGLHPHKSSIEWGSLNNPIVKNVLHGTRNTATVWIALSEDAFLFNTVSPAAAQNLQIEVQRLQQERANRQQHAAGIERNTLNQN